MSSTFLDRFIPTGSLVLQEKLRPKLQVEDADQWLHFRSTSRDDNPGDLEFLDSRPQHFLVTSIIGLSKVTIDCRRLMAHGWIHLTYNHNKGVVRVYVLPDDVDNAATPRVDSMLRKDRQHLLSQLDYSEAAWRGEPADSFTPASSHPPVFGTPALAAGKSPPIHDHSLLGMFNRIPPPDPRPEQVEDADLYDAMCSLLDSNVPGLTTTLYPYQRRSAALMLQRETRSHPVLDPRLVKVADQIGKPWYYDAVTGTSVREPRYYDRPLGGILAEEMGSGKTLICLSLILATKHIPTQTPEMLCPEAPSFRPRVGSLMDMAAACITKHSIPWKHFFGSDASSGLEYANCFAAIKRNPGSYHKPPPVGPRSVRQRGAAETSSRRIFHSNASLVLVPLNLLQQWKQEIAKHTMGLRVLFWSSSEKHPLPSLEEILGCDIVLLSTTQFENLRKSGRAADTLTLLKEVHFKRCIVDEGHTLGGATNFNKRNMQLIIDELQITAKWIATGTPSKGLYGLDAASNTASAGRDQSLEKMDLERIGSLAAFYLKMRPWANTSSEVGDTPAQWSSYVTARWPGLLATEDNCLKTTFDSVIIRHPLSELGNILPVVDKKIVFLEGSYQDRLTLNLFSMMIIFNAVQSERTDQDYFFHPRQRKALLELVGNLRQASFFGGSFFSPAQISKSIETAEEFLKESKVRVSVEDRALLVQAVEFGKLAMGNTIKDCASLFRELPVYVQDFPFGAGREWSLDYQDGDPICTASGIILELQKFLQPLLDAPNALRMMFENGRLALRGQEERAKLIEDQTAATPTPSKILAGNTELGQDSSSPVKRRATILGKHFQVKQSPLSSIVETTGIGIAAPLAKTRLISTASAKLSYLVDQVIKFQEQEQIIIFYENDNVAYYLAGVLEILQVQHLIYARGLSPQRRADYVATFNQSSKFRVLLMDITQAAFGLDMKSASRIYFINPVLNPQVEAQAIGRARRISQQKPVTVETLVLKDSVEEVILQRRNEMTQAEQRKCKSILDDKPIYEWILNAKILPLPRGDGQPINGPDQMAKLQEPQVLFGRGSGRQVSHPDEDILKADEAIAASKKMDAPLYSGINGNGKRSMPSSVVTPVPEIANGVQPPKKKARVGFIEPKVM
ncbi:P-loop containing nucleoside triphosphate hydrolase protein [Triangularia verruculosa]|uniref:P-loop containing nucleoside triphosphate hydrolase protein n=1 Tax=Triangularia verruculosa TaxID=2587418 RepID=A0AAN6XCV8_9PEZI|nr:P-loop containing nucleoside triphosphate hydrolase protein [Triangularia verruculosa]